MRMQRKILSALFTVATLAGAAIVHAVELPTEVGQCFNGGWKAYGVFKNQGDCVSYVTTNGRNGPAGGMPPPTSPDAVAMQINAAHTGVYGGSDLEPPFTQRWSKTFEAGMTISYPIITHGLVIVSVARWTVQPVIYALDQATGNVVWTATPPNPGLYADIYWGTAAYDADKIYAITASGTMTTYDVATGAQLWSTSLPYEYAFSSSPSAAKGVVYTAGSGSGGVAYAIDESTGTLLGAQPVYNGDRSSPAVSDQGVYLTFACNQDAGFSPGTLDVQWYYHTYCGGGGGRTPAYDNGRVYTRDWAGTGNLILDAATGSLLGSYGAADVFIGATPVAVAGSRLWYVSLPIPRLGLPALEALDVSDPASPISRWRFGGDGQLSAGPILLHTDTRDYVVTASLTGVVYALDADTGAQLWSASVGAPVLTPDEESWSVQGTMGAGDGLLVVPASNILTVFGAAQ